MSRRLSSEDFKKLFDVLWQPGPAIKYKCPDMWINHITKKSS